MSDPIQDAVLRAYEACGHSGMICITCAEATIREQVALAVAGAYEAVALLTNSVSCTCKQDAGMKGRDEHFVECAKSLGKVIRALTPTDAAKALAERDERTWNEAIEAAAQSCGSEWEDTPAQQGEEKP